MNLRQTTGATQPSLVRRGCGGEKNLMHENSQPAKYTILNPETGLKQARNEVETEVKYSISTAGNVHPGLKKSGKPLSIKAPIFSLFQGHSPFIFAKKEEDPASAREGEFSFLQIVVKQESGDGGDDGVE